LQVSKSLYFFFAVYLYKSNRKGRKQMIKLKNILAENMLRFGTKNLNESEKHRLIESGSTEPGDPSQSTVDLSTDYATLKSALTTYNSTVKSVMGVDPGLFLRSANEKPSQLLITSGQRQDDGGQPGGDNFVLKYDIPSGVLKRRVATKPVSFYTVPLDGNNIGTGKGYGIWFYGLNNDLIEKKGEKKKEQVKSAANVAGAAIAAFFSKVQTSVPKNYVVNQSRAYADGSAEYIFGPPTP